MPPRTYVNTLGLLLTDLYSRSHCLPPTYKKLSTLKTAALYHDPDVAILGGGITGLASAFYLSETLPNAKITLYEGTARLGGWLHSTSVDVGNGTVVFEQGPRTLRPNTPNGMVTLDLIRRLHLQDEVLMTSKNSIAAQNRFLYYPDHLVRMPGPGGSFLENFISLVTEPVFNGLIVGAVGEYFREKRPGSLHDESVGSFISRRFQPSMADNIVSAIFHGIYAGDIYQLSARSLIPLLWYYEGDASSVMKGAVHAQVNSSTVENYGDFSLMREISQSFTQKNGQPVPGTEVIANIRKSSVYTFKKGIGQLATQLEKVLKSRPLVKIHRNRPINKLESKESHGPQKMLLTSTNSGTSKKTVATHDFIISTLSSNTLYNLTSQKLTGLSQTRSVTVMVVNLYYTNPSLLSLHGFGYLLPRSLPFSKNPERALGVVFDSDATIGQDNVPGTKLTVMLGGHWWDDWPDYPDEDQGAQMAKMILARHLKIHEEPRKIVVGLQRDCIPQYTVGHRERLGRASRELLRHFGGKLLVAGNSYTGVGLNDCVRAARDVVSGLCSGGEKTGLDRFLEEEKWQRVPQKTGPGL